MLLGWLKRKVPGKASTAPGASPALPLLNPAWFDGPGGELYAALARRWAEDGPHQPTPSDAKRQVEALEARCRVTLPEDFRAYLLRAAPTETYWDHIGTQWWPIHAIKNISDECGPDTPACFNPEIEAERDSYLFFADFLIWCHAWAICCSDGPNRGRIAVIHGGSEEGFVAESFRRFLELELADAGAIHG